MNCDEKIQFKTERVPDEKCFNHRDGCIFDKL